MAENRNIGRDILVGLVTTAIGFGGAWFLQERSHTAELTAQKQASIEEAARQKEAFEREIGGQRALRAESNTMALYGEWLDPAVAARRAVATALIRSAGQRNYAALMADPAVPQAQKDALGDMLQFFARARAEGAAKELDIVKARQLFAPAASWWSGTAMPALLRDWKVERDGALPGEVVNAAFGLATLGGDLSAVAPPLDSAQLKIYEDLGPFVRARGAEPPAPLAAISTQAAEGSMQKKGPGDALAAPFVPTPALRSIPRPATLPTMPPPPPAHP